MTYGDEVIPGVTKAVEAKAVTTRARAASVNVKAETGQISSAFQETFYTYYKEFCAIRIKARKSQDEKDWYKDYSIY